MIRAHGFPPGLSATRPPQRSRPSTSSRRLTFMQAAWGFFPLFSPLPWLRPRRTLPPLPKNSSAKRRIIWMSAGSYCLMAPCERGLQHTGPLDPGGNRRTPALLSAVTMLAFSELTRTLVQSATAVMRLLWRGEHGSVVSPPPLCPRSDLCARTQPPRRCGTAAALASVAITPGIT
jgi:hypothetical protein